VPIGPGNKNFNQVGIDLAVKVGLENDIPVIPISSFEA
jgi:hypothetical protein